METSRRGINSSHVRRLVAKNFFNMSSNVLFVRSIDLCEMSWYGAENLTGILSLIAEEVSDLSVLKLSIRMILGIPTELKYSKSFP